MFIDTSPAEKLADLSNRIANCSYHTITIGGRSGFYKEMTSLPAAEFSQIYSALVVNTYLKTLKIRNTPNPLLNAIIRALPQTSVTELEVTLRHNELESLLNGIPKSITTLRFNGISPVFSSQHIAVLNKACLNGNFRHITLIEYGSLLSLEGQLWFASLPQMQPHIKVKQLAKKAVKPVEKRKLSEVAPQESSSAKPTKQVRDFIMYQPVISNAKSTVSKSNKQVMSSSQPAALALPSIKSLLQELPLSPVVDRQHFDPLFMRSTNNHGINSVEYSTSHLAINQRAHRPQMILGQSNRLVINSLFLPTADANRTHYPRNAELDYTMPDHQPNTETSITIKL